MERRYTVSDRLIIRADRALRDVFAVAQSRARGHANDHCNLDAEERRLSGALMRVNHSGEVAAQALYRGQALAARDPQQRAMLDRSAKEEHEHLQWCGQRLDELGARPSLLNPLWYAGSFAIGALAGIAGDRISLGFLAETERQVVQHLDGHIGRLPARDTRSRAILERMREDEGRHAATAISAGGGELPLPVRRAMTVVSRVMTNAALRV